MKTLFKLIPQSVHFNNPIFRTSSESAGMPYDRKYKAWEEWVTNTMQTLKEMDAELGASISKTMPTTPSAHPVLVASSTQDHSSVEILNVLTVRMDKMESAVAKRDTKDGKKRSSADKEKARK